MPTSNTPRSYGSVTKTFHWLTVLLILTAIPLGIIANKLAYDTSEALAFKAFLFSMHKTVGVTAFFVALARILWALEPTETLQDFTPNVAPRAFWQSLCTGSSTARSCWCH